MGVVSGAPAAAWRAGASGQACGAWFFFVVRGFDRETYLIIIYHNVFILFSDGRYAWFNGLTQLRSTKSPSGCASMVQCHGKERGYGQTQHA